MDKDFLLIQKMKMGDEKAIETFVKKYYQRILQYCQLHIEDRSYAEDLTQETFEKFFRSLDQYKHYGKVMNFLYVIAANNCKDYYKKKQTILVEDIEEISAKDLSNSISLNSLGACSDEGGLNDLESKMAIQFAFCKLPLELREVAILFFFQKLKQKEIARILDIGLPLVKYRIKKARALLIEALREEE